MTSTGPAYLVFPDRRQEGAFSVTDEGGGLVARISAAWTGGRFVVTTPGGRPMCEASSRWAGLSGTWRVVGADGASLLTVKPNLLRDRATVRLERGAVLVLRGNAWARDFTVRDAQGRTVMTADPAPRQRGYAVHLPYAGTLLVPEAIAVVQVWRMVRKTAVAATTAASATVVSAGS